MHYCIFRLFADWFLLVISTLVKYCYLAGRSFLHYFIFLHFSEFQNLTLTNSNVDLALCFSKRWYNNLLEKISFSLKYLEAELKSSLQIPAIHNQQSYLILSYALGYLRRKQRNWFASIVLKITVREIGKGFHWFVLYGRNDVQDIFTRKD